MKRSHWVLFTVGLLFAGFVLLPILSYVAGGKVVGPYTGPRGLASYLSAIYSDAARGRTFALLLIGGPLLAAGVWPLRAWALRRRRERSPVAENTD